MPGKFAPNAAPIPEAMPAPANMPHTAAQIPHSTPSAQNTPNGAAPAFALSDKAAARIATLLAQEPAQSVMRVAVEGGGCSGFQYRFALENAPQAGDFTLSQNGARIVLDPQSAQYLQGSELDFVTNLMGQSFQVRNPNAKTACGCGVSFSL